VNIDTICNIIDAKLLNKPSVNLVSTWTTNVDKVEDGSLFIAINHDEIPQAVTNGAYAIISQTINHTDIKKDIDIAWIHTTNLKLVCIKLKRFQLNSLDISGFVCDSVVFDIFQTVIKKNNHIHFLSNNILDDFDHIVKTPHKIYISNDETYIDKLIPQYKHINEGSTKDATNIICHSLFVTSFVFNNYSFDKIRLPSLYIKQFLSIFEFIKKQHLKDIKIDITMLKYLNIFCPIFIDTRLHIVEFGKTNSFVLSNENTLIAHKQIEFIEQKFAFLRLNVIDGFLNLDDIRKSINTDKNINYIVGLPYKQIKDMLSQKSLICQTSSLF
jgi:ferrochelatase